MPANPEPALPAGLASAFTCIVGMSLAGCAAPLISAAQEGDVARVKELLASGADPNVDDSGIPAILFAAMEGHTQVLAALIEAGANVNAADRNFGKGFTALHLAAMHGRRGAVLFLLDHGADPTMLARSKTPRQWAQEEGHSDIAQLLATAEARGVAALQPSVAPVAIPPLRQPKSLLVLPLRGEGGLAEHVPVVLTRLLLTELQAVRGMQTHSMDDFQAMLGIEKQKDLLGCDSTTCMVELAGALGTDLVLYGSLGKLGASVSWSVSVLEPSTGRVAGRASLSVQGGEDALAASAPALVADLVTKLNDSATHR